MGAQKGSALLIKRGDDASPQSFSTVAGLRSKSISLNEETVDVTNSDSSGKFRELLAAAGVKSATVTGTGVFKNGAGDESIRGDYFNSAIIDYQIVIPGFGTIEGPFQIASLQYAGEHNGEMTWEITLESAGILSWTAF